MISSGHVGDDDHLWTFLRDSDLSAGSIRGHFIEFYSGLPFDTHYVDLFSQFFEALATSPGPLLVHCTGGKDRTGMIVALTHRLLDVHPDDIISDYLLSNQAWDFDLHGAFVASWICEEIGSAPEQAGVRAVMEVDQTYLDAAFAAIEAQAGSLDAYFETGLGITREARDAIALRLTDRA